VRQASERYDEIRGRLDFAGRNIVERWKKQKIVFSPWSRSAMIDIYN
jgi:hypothetical protein